MKNGIRKLVRWLTTAGFATHPRRRAGKIVTYLTANNRLRYFYSHPMHAQALSVIRSVKKEADMLLDDLQAYQLFSAIKKTEGVPGEIAEVGVYMGGSAKLICEATKKPVRLFDTFEGLPEVSESDSTAQFKTGEYSAQLEYVKKTLKQYRNVHFYKGLFPSTAGPIRNKQFSCVHLDVDIYDSTKSGLEFFYPRLSRGGILISHDYPASVGVKKAFDEFFRDKPEIIVELPLCDQCLVIKL